MNSELRHREVAGRLATMAICLVFSALFLWFIVSNFRPIQSVDLWWHLASGRLILQQHAIPFQDVFSSTAKGSSWVDSYWLFEILLYLASLKGNVGMIILLKSLLVAFIMALQCMRLRDRHLAWFWVALGAALTYMGAHPRGYGWSEQANLVSLFFLTILFRELEYYATHNKLHWGMIPPFCLWANMHRGFTLGLFLAGLCLAGQCLENRKIDRRQALWLVCCAAATLINPYGLGLYAVTLKDLALSPQHISGWARTPFAHLEILWALLPALPIALGVQRVRTKTWSWGIVLVSLFLMVEAIRYVVNAPIFVVYAIPLVIQALAESSSGMKITRCLAQRTTATALAALGILVAALSFSPAGAGVNKTILPVEACDFIEQEHLNGTAFQDYAYGGYWMWRFGQQRPVFIDGRYPMVAGYIPLLTELNQARTTPEKWQAFLSKYRVDLALVPYPSQRGMPFIFRLYFPRDRWALVYWDDLALIFVRRTPALAPWILRHEFTAADPEADPAAVLAELRRSPDSFHRWLTDIRRNQTIHPASLRTARWLKEATKWRFETG